MGLFCKSLLAYSRRPTSAVRIGGIEIGAGNPVAVQSMANCSTLSTDECVDQIAAVAAAGCRIMRFTAPSMREAENLRYVKERAAARGFGDVALVADIHFTPDVALVAADYVDKVRINPGNFRNDAGQLEALVDKCRARGLALRIGVNHGSLAAHVVERYGDTPAGMVASAMEFLRECRRLEFDRVVVSMKSSNVRVMVYAYRLLCAAMDSEGMSYPLHLGVTEAGDGDDGRIKSAVGIGALMADGIGDTIRVSLTEPPQNEVPVARTIADYFGSRTSVDAPADEDYMDCYSPYEYRRRETLCVDGVGGQAQPVLYSELTAAQAMAVEQGRIAVLDAVTDNPVAEWRAALFAMSAAGDNRPVILHRVYDETDWQTLLVKASADFGPMFIDGLADGLWVENSAAAADITPERIDSLSLSILQAARVRMSKTEYIACPGCGRTLYDLQRTLAAIRERTSHLKGLKIGVMGCIVNGPGEMADADYGYVGEGRGKVTLYKGRQVVRRAIDQSEAIDALVQLIKDNGQWREPDGR